MYRCNHVCVLLTIYPYSSWTYGRVAVVHRRWVCHLRHCWMIQSHFLQRHDLDEKYNKLFVSHRPNDAPLLFLRPKPSLSTTFSSLKSSDAMNRFILIFTTWFDVECLVLLLKPTFRPVCQRLSWWRMLLVLVAIYLPFQYILWTGWSLWLSPGQPATP